MMWHRKLPFLLVVVPTLIAQAVPGKLEAPLQAMYDAWKAKGSTGLHAEAFARGVSLRSNRVNVRIAGTREDVVPLLRKAALRNGARVVSADGSSLFVEVPVSHLPKLAADSQVVGIYVDRPQQRPQIRQD